MRIGSLFSGYGGLDLATEAVFGGTTAWVADIDKGACKVLAQRFADAPNLGDITATDWSTIEPVDVITGGSPCQDLSHAGRRAGMTEGTRSNLWVAMREAIAQLRPTYVIWENVRGAYSAAADSAVVVGPRLLARGDARGVYLRALGRVLGDLSDLGYDCQWRGLRAADVGAPHGRFRVFVIARLADTLGEHRGERRIAGPGEAPSGRASADDRGRPGTPLSLLPTPVTQPSTGNGHARNLAAEALLPTPAVNDMGKAYTPDEWDAWTAKMQAAHGNGNGHGKSLEIEAARLLPTPNTMDHIGARSDEALARARQAGGCANLKDVRELEWGQYADAIARWQATTGLPAPEPTKPTGRAGAHRLSPRFTEWMMGLPAGWITDVPDVTRNEALKLCGNGVVPQQAHAAIVDALLAWEAVA